MTYFIPPGMYGLMRLKGQNTYLINEATFIVVGKGLGTGIDCARWYSEYEIGYIMSS
jgi:hypothetical protein